MEMYSDPFLLLWDRLLDTLGFEGLCCINYKLNNGRPLLLEINPRFGGSLGEYFFAFLRHLEPLQPLNPSTLLVSEN